MIDTHNKVTVYTPSPRIKNPFRVFGEIFFSIFRSGGLGFRLFSRDLSALYRASILGYVWTVIPPLLTAGIWIFLRGQNVVAFGRTGVPYPVYVLVSMMLWQIFTDSVTAPVKSAQQSKEVLGKVNFPRESIITAAFFMTLFNSVIKLGIIAGLFMYFKIVPSWTVVPGILCIISLIVFGFTIGICLVPVALMYMDFERSIQVGLQFLLYLTPVVYPVPETGKIAAMMKFNPLVPVFETIRALILSNEAVYWREFIVINSVVLIVLLVGIFMFTIGMPIVNERLGSR